MVQLYFRSGVALFCWVTHVGIARVRGCCCHCRDGEPRRGRAGGLSQNGATERGAAAAVSSADLAQATRLGSSLSTTLFQLGDLGQVTQLFWASVSSCFEVGEVCLSLDLSSSFNEIIRARCSKSHALLVGTP